MKVSVALAAYNGAKYIIEQLRSILRQSVPVDEVIIRDDCSSDETVSLVNEFIAENGLTGWHFTVNEKNLGYAENFRRAVDECTGELIFLCDQDDIWVGDRVEAMVHIMDSHPEIGLLNTQYTTFRQEGEGFGSLPESRRESEYIPEKISLSRKTFFIQYPGCVMCVRRSFYEEIKKYWRHGWTHDAFFWGMALQLGECYSVPYVSLLRRIHVGQTSGNVGHDKERRIRYLDNVLRNSEAMLYAAKENDAPEKDVQLYIKMVRTHRYRLELVRDRKLTRAITLLQYLAYYNRAKSYGVELMLAIRGKI